MVGRVLRAAAPLVLNLYLGRFRIVFMFSDPCCMLPALSDPVSHVFRIWGSYVSARRIFTSFFLDCVGAGPDRPFPMFFNICFAI